MRASVQCVCGVRGGLPTTTFERLLTTRGSATHRAVPCRAPGLTCCVFYYRDRLVELEPIGPLENLGTWGHLAAWLATFMNTAS